MTRDRLVGLLRFFRAPTDTNFLVGAALVLIIFGYFLAMIGPQNPPAYSVAHGSAIFLPTRVLIQQKPQDKLIFFGTLAALSVELLIISMAARRSRDLGHNASSFFWVLCGACTLIAIISGALGSASSLFEHYQFIWTFLCAGLAVLMYLRPEARLGGKWFLLSAMVVSAAALAGQRLWTLHNIDYGAGYTSHYDAVAFAVVGAASGGTCLADIIAQYGCHGEFMAPLLRLLGPSVLTVTGMFLVAQVVATWAALLFASRIIRTEILFLACVFWIFIDAVLNLAPSVYDVILQYYPVRFLFPALSLLILCWLQDDLNLRRSVIAGIFAGTSLCWNLEAGIATTIALMIFIFVGRFNDPSWRVGNLSSASARTVAYAATAIVTVIAFVAYLHLKSGQTIDPRNYIIFQTTFYQTGFGLIPIPPFPNYWTIHAAIILAVLVLASISMGAREIDDPNLERAAYLAVLAIGLTLYYTGRSHILVLRLVSWPDGILLLYLADRYVRSAHAQQFVQAKALAVFQIVALALTSSVFVANIPSVWALSDVSRLPSDDLTPMERDVSFIASKTNAGEQIGIVAANQATLYGETHTRPALAGVGVAEMVRRTDFDQLQGEIIAHGPQKLFFGSALEISYGILGADLPFDFRKISQIYALAAWGPGGRLMYLKRKPYSGTDLFAANGPKPQWHGVTPRFAQAWDKNRGGRWARPNALRVVVPNAHLGRSFAVRIVLVPTAPEPIDAFLFSSYCCGQKGFFLRRDPDTADGYYAGVGDGTTIHASPTFRIPAGQASELFASYDDGRLRVFVNQKLAAEKRDMGLIASSGVPVVIGGWYGPDALFSGEIKEVEFFSKAIAYP